MTYRRSLDFLPNVFRTDINDKFLNATLDQLISEPNLRRVDGYVGRRFSPVSGKNDSFIQEISKSRQDYQLEPATVFVDKDGKIKFSSSYNDLLQRISSVGGIINDPNRLFSSDYYSYDGFIDYDKFLNYSSYYWIPNGPNPVTISSFSVPFENNYTVFPPSDYQTIDGRYDFESFDSRSFDTTENDISLVRQDGIRFDTTGDTINPTLRLARGGIYTFQLDQKGHGFFIQSEFGTTDTLSWQNNLSTREVLGVENNGEDSGTITFRVPQKFEQDYFINLPEVNETNFVAYSFLKSRSFRYNELQLTRYQDLVLDHGGIDGVSSIVGKTVIFLDDPSSGINPQPWQANTFFREGSLLTYGDQIYRVLSDFTTTRIFNTSNLEIYDLGDSWYDPQFFDSGGFDSTAYDRGAQVPEENRRGRFLISVNSEGFVTLTPVDIVSRNQKTKILAGIRYGNRDVYRDSTDSMQVVPNITANLDRLYYCDSLDPNIGGIIEIIDQGNELFLDVNSILGKSNYISPNNVEFTNGLKVRFIGDALPTSYRNKEYYVEGVGTNISLVPVDEMLADEPWLESVEFSFDMQGFDSEAYSGTTNAPLVPDYLAINRASKERSAWVRHNRWFHEDVINKTAKYNNYSPDFSGMSKARRPILEFDPDLQLFNFGVSAKKPITVIDTSTTDAFSQVEGTGVSVGDDGVFSYYSDSIPLTRGMRVVFSNDSDISVRQRVYRVEWILPQIGSADKEWKFISDGSTNIFPLGMQISDSSRLQVFVGNDLAIDSGYQYSYNSSTQSIIFSSSVTSGEEIKVKLQFNKQIHLVEDDIVTAGDVIYSQRGLRNQGKMFYFNGSKWIESQQKTKINQAPLFDLYDSDGISFGDENVYVSNNFTGNKLFSYQQGTGPKDPVLGLRLKYRNIDNIGDILFEDSISKGSLIYRSNQTSITRSLSGARVKVNHEDSIDFRSQWTKAKEKSKQFQLQTYYATQYQRNLFELNVPPNGAGIDKLKNLIVYINNSPIMTTEYNIQKEGDLAFLLLNNDLSVNDKLDIKIFSDVTNGDSSFEIPHSYDRNPFNQEVYDITLGQMRSHILATYEKISELEGQYIGNNNSRDLGNIKNYGGKILQHDAAPHLANFLLNDSTVNFIESVIYAQREYTRFKNRFLEAAKDISFAVTDNFADTVDRIINDLILNKNKNFPFFASDMIPFGKDFVSLKYTIVDERLKRYDLSDVYDSRNPNRNSVLVYLNGKQLVLNRDYEFSIDGPTVDIKISLNENDELEIREYTNTDGSYIPPTPTKLGLYPASIPGKISDGYGENTRVMLKGHDGSFIAAFNDYRDDILLELETRIYNNIKVSYNREKFDIFSYIPGAFRETAYSRDEFLSILSSQFSTWLGGNNISMSDYRLFESNDSFTFNYTNFTNRLDGKAMPAANWRGLYYYYYDTCSPHQRPWEMLGFNDKPDWWERHYGPAPYTNGNSILWNDIEQGRIADGTRAGIDKTYARPGLSKILPVDSNGELLDPYQTLVKDGFKLDLSGFYKFGDGGPVENVWKTSSEYPFVLQIAVALMAPGSYFGCNIDNNTQQIIDNRLLFSDTGLKALDNRGFHGEISGSDQLKTNGYLTWISDFCKSKGYDITEVLGNKLRNLTPRLAYKVEGYTDKKYIKISTDQFSPGSNNPGIIIPDEDFDIVLTKSAPTKNLTYSGVIVTKTVDGYAVTGYDDNKPYFNIIPSSINANKSLIKVSKLSVIKYKDGKNQVVSVPYGSEFYSVEDLAEFLICYGRYLEKQGFKFTDKLDIDASWYQDWDLSVREFLFFVQQNWEVDVAITLSPVGKKINYQNDYGVVDGLSNRPFNTRVVDEDFKIVRAEDYSVYRKGRDFRLEINDERGIYLLDLNVVEYEHMLVFNNKTRFNDIIYDPITGDRQHRLKIQGFKTSGWDGSYGAAGFVINEDNIEEWQPGVNYHKGDIVIYDGRYYTANVTIPSSLDFDENNWITSDYEKVKKGLLPNLANRAGLSKKFYDVNEINLESDTDILAKNLIGFESRDYMVDLGLTDTSQFKFYQGMLSQKGTNNSLDKLLNARLDNFGGSADIYEEWALKLGSYGATKSTQNIRMILDDQFAIKDPIVIEINDINDPKTKNWINLTKKDIIEGPVPFDKNFLGLRSKNRYSTDLPSAGYARLDDAEYLSPTRELLNPFITNNTDVGEGDYVWIAADRNNQWGIYRVSIADIELESIVVNFLGVATVKCKANHNLELFDLIQIKSANTVPTFSGFFEVQGIQDSRTFVINTNLSPTVANNLIGLVHKLIPMRFENANQIAAREPKFGWKKGDRLFIDQIANGGWGVYEKTEGWINGNDFSQPDPISGDLFGTSVASSLYNNTLIIGRPGYPDINTSTPRGGVLIYTADSDGNLSLKSNISATSDNIIDFGATVAASDSNVMAAGAPKSDYNIGFVYVIDKKREDDSFAISQVIAPADLDLGGEFGTAIAVSNDEQWLIVGQPNVGSGYVYVYQRRIVTVPAPVTQIFDGDGISDTFTLTGDAANPNDITSLAVYKDLELLEPITDFTLSGNDVILSAAPILGSIITVTVTRKSPELEFNGDGSTTNFTLTGDSANLTSLYALYVEVSGKIMIPFRDYIVVANGDLYDVEFSVPPASNTRIKIYQKNHYELVSIITPSDGNIGDKFGSSIALSDNAKQILIGAPEKNGYSETSVGAVYVYDRTSEAFFADGETAVFTTNTTIFGNPLVSVDDQILVRNQGYSQIGNSIVFDQAPDAGSVIKIETNNFNETTIIDPTSAGDTEEEKAGFGTSIAICPTNCSVYIGSPYRDAQKTNSGKVYRFINQGRAYGDIIGTISDPIISSYSIIKINDFDIILDQDLTLDEVVAEINFANIPGVSASINDQNCLVISSNSLIVGEKLLIYPVFGPAISDLGLDIYTHQQTILAPTDEDYAEFGQSLIVGATSDYLVIGSHKASSTLETYFDNKETYFDSTSTLFNDVKKNSGSVWVYQYIGTPNTRADNPGKFIPALKLLNPKIDSLDEFGKSIAINKYRIYVGAPGDDTAALNAGIVFSFENTGIKTWQLTRQEDRKVDIELINRVYLYNKEKNEIILDLDFIDPAKNKISGFAAQEITYTAPYDPATYSVNDSGNVWGEEQVGQVWWDVSQIRWLEYEQGDNDFRSLNWNTAFPGSTALCYEWVKSTNPPSNYSDTDNPRSYPRNRIDYITDVEIDPVTNISTTYYYYWVAGKQIPSSNRAFSTVALESIIANPRTAGIPFVAFIATNAIALYNISNYLDGKDVVLHIDYDVKKNTNSIHTEYQLISEGDPRSLPNIKILDKLIDSLAGIDRFTNLVPDIKLSEIEKYGLLFRPRQTMFGNRTTALRNAVNYINSVLVTIPAVDSKYLGNVQQSDPIPLKSDDTYDSEVNDYTELNYLITEILPSGYSVLVRNDETIGNRWAIYQLDDNIWNLVKVQAFDCSKYIEVIDWVKPGENDPSVTDYVVDFSYQLTTLDVALNQTVKIKNAGDGRYIIVKATDQNSFEVIKRQNATIRLKDSIWNQFILNQGFDVETFDVQLFDEWPAEEIQRIIRAIYFDVFTGLEEIEKNRFFFKMLEYALSERKNVDWAFKTSFLKIEHKNRQAMSQISVLQRDRQDNLRKYIDEVKPYHSKVREFVNTHVSEDLGSEYLTDFDLPSYYNPSSRKYLPVDGSEVYESVILDNYPWKDWADNYPLEIESVDIYYGGEGYLEPPNITVSGNGGAKLTARIVGGKIINVKVDNPGKYTSTPNLTLSSGDAILIPVMANRKVRSNKTTLKFDRISNNGGFLVQFIDSYGYPVDIRDQRKSRLYGEHGIIDDLLDALSSFEWLKDSEENIGYPVPNVGDYRIFDDSSGRIQVQYKKIPGGWTATILQNYLRDLYFAGAEGIDIGGTIVVSDGSTTYYTPSVLQWQEYTRYDMGDIIIYNNKAYTPTIQFTSEDIFTTDNLRMVRSDEFENHIDRIWTYYKPREKMLGKDISQLITGADFPGVKIKGPHFNQEPGFDVGRYDMTTFDQYIIGPEGVPVLDPKILDQTIYSNFLDTSLGTRPEDINVMGGDFVDAYNSHAPEEMIPGRVYDTLDIKVYTVPSDSWDNRPLGMNIILSSQKIDNQTTFKYNPTSTSGDTLIVFTRLKQRLTEGKDYTANRTDNTITLEGNYLPDDSLLIYSIDAGGQGLIYDNEYKGNGVTSNYFLRVPSNFVTQSLITIDGIKQTTGFDIDQDELGLAVLRFEDPPADGSSIHIHLFNTSDPEQRYVEIHTQELTFDTTPLYPEGYSVVLDRVVGTNYTLADKIIVELDGLRLRPPNQAYYISNNNMTYQLPSTAYVLPESITEAGIEVAVDGVRKIANVDWVLEPYDGSTIPSVTFTNTLPIGSEITLSLTVGAEYRLIGNNTLLINENLKIQENSKLTITSFTDHSYLGIRTQVFQGTVAQSIEQPIGFDSIGFDSVPLDSNTFDFIKVRDYELSRPVTNISYIWVTLDYSGSGGGIHLKPNIDFTLITPTKLRLAENLLLSNDSILTVTHFSEVLQKSSIAFRVFKDLNDNFDYFRISSENSTKITQTVRLGDREIYVQDASRLAEPNIELAIPGRITVGGEVIHYYVRDLENNKLGQIRRGVSGTGAINIIPPGTIIYDISEDQAVPNAHNRIWYNNTNVSASDGNGLQNSSSEQAKFLLERRAILDSLIFDPAYFVSGYVQPGYVEGNLYK